MAAWKRRKNWAWPDWTYFFSSIVLSPLLNILLGHPLSWMDSWVGRRERVTLPFVFGAVVLFILLNRLDPIGRIMRIPGDEAFENPDGTPKGPPRSKRQQAVTGFWITIGVTAAIGAGVAWVVHLSSAPGSEYHVQDHEAVLFLFLIGGLATLVLWLSLLVPWVVSLTHTVQARLRGR